MRMLLGCSWTAGWARLVLAASAMCALALAQNCLGTTNNLVILESQISDTSVVRTYTMCPNTNYSIGELDFSNALVNGQDMLPLRSNIRIRCGDDGSPKNLCIFVGGAIHVDGTGTFGILDTRLDNVVLQGLTFINASRYNVWINKPGDVLFEDCVFRVRSLVCLFQCQWGGGRIF
jgi:hypothetical protein